MEQVMDRNPRSSDANAHGTIGDVVYERIRDDILSGELHPGMKLKLEQLKRKYDVSINTLRETLVRLASEGLVEAEGQKGFRVVPISLVDLLEIAELRQVLECHAVRQSIEKGDLKWEGRVVAAHHMLARCERQMMEDSAAHSAEWQKLDREFHIALMSACQSRWIMRVYRQIHDQYLRYQYLALKSIGFRGEVLLDEHQALRDHVLNRDVDAATDLLAKHIQAGTKLQLSNSSVL